MHPMMIVGAVLHAAVFAVVAFFVLYAAQRAQGLVKLFGNGLGICLLVIAALALLAAATAPLFGGRPFGMAFGPMAYGPSMHRHMERHCPNELPDQAPAKPANQSAPEPA